MYVEEYMSYQWCALAIKPPAVLKSQSSQKYTKGALGNLAWSPPIIFFLTITDSYASTCNTGLQVESNEIF